MGRYIDANSRIKKFCILIRGKPSAGKSTISNLITYKLPNTKLLDPDQVDTSLKKYKHFRPRMTKNPSDNIKMYCYLFNDAETSLKKGISVIWTQPWSRFAEIDLTIRNFFYYFNDRTEKVWQGNITSLANSLPFKLLVAEISIEDEISLQRYLEKHKGNTDIKRMIARLKKTQQYFQPLSIELPTIIVSGVDEPTVNASKIIQFINENI